MSTILCWIFGHRYEHVGPIQGCWSRHGGCNGWIGEWFKTIRVRKECARCGYFHHDSFLVPDEWAPKPGDGP